MADQLKSDQNFSEKGVNLLKDVYGREQARRQVYLVYRMLSIIFVFVLIIFTSIWGWTLYEITRIKKVDAIIEVKKAELSKHMEDISALLSYSARVDQIISLKGSDGISLVQVFDELEELRIQSNAVITKYTIYPQSISLTIKLFDETNLYWFEQLINEKMINKKWLGLQISSINQIDSGDYEVVLTSKLGNLKDN